MPSPIPSKVQKNSKATFLLYEISMLSFWSLALMQGKCKNRRNFSIAEVSPVFIILIMI
jgi:hypothetical protein